MSGIEKPVEGVTLSDAEKARRSKRNRWIALSIAGLVVLFYLITVFKMGSTILKRSL